MNEEKGTVQSTFFASLFEKGCIIRAKIVPNSKEFKIVGFDE